MREKEDLQKILEGRCKGQGAEYVAFKKANEAHSTGTATMIFDPIAGRTVDVLSTGEMMLFWLLRFDEHVVEIREQMLLVPNLVADCARELGVGTPKKILTTDFLTLRDDGAVTAYSVKYSRNQFDGSTAAGKATIRRQALEKRYWEKLNVNFKIVFTTEMDRHKAINISDCMEFYDSTWVHTPDQKYRWLIAHHVIETDMSKPIPFSKISGTFADEITSLYRREVNK